MPVKDNLILRLSKIIKFYENFITQISTKKIDKKFDQTSENIFKLASKTKLSLLTKRAKEKMCLITCNINSH